MLFLEGSGKVSRAQSMRILEVIYIFTNVPMFVVTSASTFVVMQFQTWQNEKKTKNMVPSVELLIYIGIENMDRQFHITTNIPTRQLKPSQFLSMKVMAKKVPSFSISTNTKCTSRSIIASNISSSITIAVDGA